MYKFIILLVLLYEREISVSSANGKQIEGAQDHGTEENIWTKEGGSNRRLKKIA
jgi:hypothetical protein